MAAPESVRRLVGEARGRLTLAGMVRRAVAAVGATAALAAGLVAAWNDGSALPLAVVISLCALLACLCAWLTTRTA